MATQAERTARTQERLLDATLACLAEGGMRALSTPAVCERAGVSRGAQLHHFPTRSSLVVAAVEHLVQRRLAELRRELGGGGSLDVADATRRIWKIYKGPAFHAWLELVVAARTDAELRDALVQVDRRFVAEAERLVRERLLPAGADDATVTAVTRLLLAIFDGLGTHAIVGGEAPARGVFRLLAATLPALVTGTVKERPRRAARRRTS
jgi:AcrR family transcriptional regulator